MALVVESGTGPTTVEGTAGLTSDYQFELNGTAFGFGLPTFVEAEGFDPSGAEWRTQDVEIAHGDGIRFGEDFLAPPVWAFNLGVDRTDPVTAMAELARVQSAWRPVNVRTPGAVSVLRYRVAGRTRRVYGRPGRFARVLDNRIISGYVAAVADFRCADHLTYDDTLQSALVSFAPPPTTGGLVSPLTSPLTSQRSLTSDRQGSITVGGDAPTWPVIVVAGPISNPRVECVGQWTLELNLDIAEGQRIVVDTAPWARTVRRGRASVAGSVGRKTRLSDMDLPPGGHQIRFTGTSSLATATVTVSWRNASHSL